MEIKGVLKKVQPTITRGNFESRKIWITIDQDTQYPQTIELEASGKNVGIFSNIPMGAGITCHINLRGREWKNKQDEIVVFNTISVWKVETIASEIKKQPAQQPQVVGVEDINSQPADDLPF